MKKVLLIILAGMFSFSQANAQMLEDASITVGLGMSESVFAATGQERNHNESGTLRTTVEEYGAFNEDYASIFVEAGNEMASIGVSLASKFSTPENISGDERDTSNAANKVQAEFENFINIYGLVRIPLGGLYAKVGYASADVVVTNTSRSGVTYPGADIDGYTVAFGWDQQLANGFGIRAEIQGHEFDDVEVNNGVAASGNINYIKISDMIGATGTLSVTKTF
mgnify:CR=1 FL=1|tara:strand:- start:778 stop:1449 length:672 start_codon:yes stop_codon:yes gene_type:complete